MGGFLCSFDKSPPLGQEPAVRPLEPTGGVIIRPDVIEERLKAESPTPIIVTLVQPDDVIKTIDWGDKTQLAALHQVTKDLEERVLNSLDPEHFQVRHRYENFAGFSGYASADGIGQLQKHPSVEFIEPVQYAELQLRQGIPLINGTAYRSDFDGSGVSIAIVDSGIDYNHPKLEGGGFPNQKVIGGYDIADMDADPGPFPSPPTGPHGTACAGIAAGDLDNTGDYIGGIAYGAKLYALKVFADSENKSASDDIMNAWDWCMTHKNDDPNNPILAISNSIAITQGQSVMWLRFSWTRIWGNLGAGRIGHEERANGT